MVSSCIEKDELVSESLPHATGKIIVFVNMNFSRSRHIFYYQRTTLIKTFTLKCGGDITLWVWNIAKLTIKFPTWWSFSLQFFGRRCLWMNASIVHNTTENREKTCKKSKKKFHGHRIDFHSILSDWRQTNTNLDREIMNVKRMRLFRTVAR